MWVAHQSFAFGRPNEMVCGLHTASLVFRGSNKMVCGTHTALLASEMMLQEGGGTNSLLPTHGFPILLLLPLPTNTFDSSTDFGWNLAESWNSGWNLWNLPWNSRNRLESTQSCNCNQSTFVPRSQKDWARPQKTKNHG